MADWADAEARWIIPAWPPAGPNDGTRIVVEVAAALRAAEHKGLERAVAEAKNYTAPPIIGQDCRTAEAVLITRKRIVAAIQSLIDQGPSEAITPASPGDG